MTCFPLRTAVGFATIIALLTTACEDHRLESAVGFPAVVDATNPGTFLPPVLTNVNGCSGV